MNPFVDVTHFLTANTSDFNALGVWKYGLLAVFYALFAGGLVAIVINWTDDLAQRNAQTLALCGVRMLIGCMWFEGMLWKLPFSPDNGLHYWMEQMAGRAAFAVQREFVANVLLPHFALIDPLVFLAEFGFAASLLLGLFVRLSSVGAILFSLNLWLGIYVNRGSDPAEWSWSYMFLILLQLLFLVFAAGRALGVDAVLRRRFGSRGLPGIVT